MILIKTTNYKIINSYSYMNYEKNIMKINEIWFEILKIIYSIK